jgi:hypothetical protein
VTTLSDLVLTCLDPSTNKLAFKVRINGYKLLGAAAMYDLLDRGRLGFDGEGRQAKVVLRDVAPVAEPSLEFALGRYRAHAWTSPRNCLNELCSGTKIYDGVFGSLVQEGHLIPRPARGIGGKYRFQAPDQARREWLLGGVEAALLSGQSVPEPIRRIAVIMAVGDDDAGRLVPVVTERPGVGAPGERAAALRALAVAAGRQLARDDLVALALWRSIELPKSVATIGATLGLADAAIPE